MKYNKSFFQKNIKHIRKMSGMTQASFGKELCISQHTISIYENGANPNPTLENLIIISKFSNRSIEDLLTVDLEDDTFNFGTRKPNSSEFEYSHFTGKTYCAYYFTENQSDLFYTGYITFDDEYDNEHLFLHGTAVAGHYYDCKMVIEDSHTFYIYGTERNEPRRFHILMYYPDFRDEQKYHAGLGLLTRIDSEKRLAAMKLAIVDKELDLYDFETEKDLKNFLSCIDEKEIIRISRIKDEEFRNWVRQK